MATGRSTPVREDAGKLILRLTVGGLMLFHGVAKLKHGVGWLAGPLHAHHLPSWVGYGVYVGEVLAPILLIVGIFTRPAALLVVIDLLFALVLVVKGTALQLNPQTGALASETLLLYLLGALAIAFLGSGRFGLSRGRGRWD